MEILFKDLLTDDVYVNRFETSLAFHLITRSDLFEGPLEFEKVEEKDLINKLREAKRDYVDLYFEP